MAVSPPLRHLPLGKTDRLDQDVDLRRTHRNSVRFEEPGLTGVGVEPHFAIGQRALLVRTPTGNVLWDCVPLLDPALVEMVRALSGVSTAAVPGRFCLVTAVHRPLAPGRDFPLTL